MENKVNKEPAHIIAEQIEFLDTVNPSEALDRVLASKKDAKDKDLMYIKFRFVHEGSNKNFDGFEAEDLEERHTTAIYKPLNLEHNEKKIVGTIYDTEYVSSEKSDNGKAGVNIYTVMYKGLFPAVANEIKKKYTEGKLNCSMETWYDKAKCSVCGSEYEDESEYCEHLKGRFSTGKCKRILKGITFGGAGIVENPADEDASALAIASKTDAGELKDKIDKNMEMSRFVTIIREAENMYYNIVYYSSNNEDTSDKKKKLNALIIELKSLLDTVNVNKISKGEMNNMPSVMNLTPEELVDALMSKANTDNKEAFAAQLNEKLENVKAEHDTKMAELKADYEGKLETLKAEKEAVSKEYATYKANVEKANLIASRKAVLAEKKIDVSFEDDETIYSMTDKVFDLFVKSNAVKAPEPKPKTVVTDEPDGTANATASLNVQDADKNKKDKEVELLSVLNKL